VVLVWATAIARATIPVIDYSNLAQNVQTALKTAASYAQQVQSYQTQLLQYKNQILNTTGLAPALQVYQQAQSTMRNVFGISSMFSSGNGLQNYLQTFRDVNYWLSVPPGNQSQNSGSAIQTQANDALVKGIVAQQQQIQQDAAALEKLQTGAATAQGQKAAIDAANQLAALEQQQLLQIRALLVQEQQALAARNGAVSNQEAIGAANTQQFLNSTESVMQPRTGWHP
jgi:type IV secretion system protein TrbJ